MALLVGAFALSLAGSLHGQSTPAPAGPFIPLGSTLDRLISWLIHEGALTSINPLVRPFRMAMVRSALAREDTVSLSSQGRSAFRMLARELRAMGDSTMLFAELGLAQYSNGRRDSFRPGGGSGTAPAGGLYLAWTAGHFVAVANPAFENRLRDDPEYTGKVDRLVAGRVQESYAAILTDRFDVVYGRMSRNWGPDLFDGLQLSSSAYAHDEISGSLRSGRFELQSIAQRLDDFGNARDSLATPVTRYFFAHRLSIHAASRWWLSFVESGVYSGEGRGFEPAFHAPLNLALLSEFNERLRVNVLLGVDIFVRIGKRSSLELGGYLDDIQVDRQALSDRRPTSYGLTVVGRTALPDAPWHLAVGYTRISSLAYRNSVQPDAQYAYHGVGIGRNYSDYDQLLARAETQSARGVRATLEATYIRQGAGDFRDPFPSDTVLAQPGTGFLLAPVTRLLGFRTTLSLEVTRGVAARSELGVLRRGSSGGSVFGGVAVSLQADLLRQRLGTPLSAVQTGMNRDWP